MRSDISHAVRNHYGFEPDVFPVNPSESMDVRTQFDMPNRLSKFLIELRCTDNSLLTFAIGVGLIVMAMQIVPIVSNQWVLITEPIPINRTDDNGVQLKTVYEYHMGYLQMCINETGVPHEQNFHFRQPQLDPVCFWTPAFTGRDLTRFSIATLAIIHRVHICMALHVVGSIMSLLAILFALLGHINRNVLSLYSTILYVSGGLIVCIAVLQFICIVDDEMVSKQKPSAFGDPSNYSYQYGNSFYMAALSFPFVQLCAICQALLYFRRYPSIDDKLRLIPGLQARVQEAQMSKDLGILIHSSDRRGSLCTSTLSPTRRSISFTHHPKTRFIIEAV